MNERVEGNDITIQQDARLGFQYSKFPTDVVMDKFGVLVPPVTTDFNFVLFSDHCYTSPREHELRMSQVRSHAAKAAHKARQLPIPATSPVPTGDSGRSKTAQLEAHSATLREAGAPILSLPTSLATTTSEKDKKSCANIAGYVGFLLEKEAKERAKNDEASAVQWHWLGGGTRVDPFSCIPGLDQFGESGKAFDWLVQYVSPNVAAICEPFGVSNLYGRWLLEQMAVYLDVFHVMMAALHGGLVALTAPGAPHRSFALMHKASALRALQQRLAAPNAWADDGAKLTMLYLALLEDAAGAHDTSTIHRHQLQSLIAIRGGVQSLRTASGIKAMIEHSPPEFIDAAPRSSSDYSQLCQYPDLPVDLTCVSDIAVPPGFYELASTGVLSYQTIDCIRRIAAPGNFGVTPSAFSIPSQSCSEDIDPSSEAPSSHFVDFRQACPALTLPDDSDGQPPLDKVMCLALIRYCLNCVNGERPAARCYAHNLTLELKQQLIPGHQHTTILTDALQQRSKIPPRNDPDPVKKLEREAMIWMWLMAIDTWSLPKFELSNAGKLLLIHVLGVFSELQDMNMEDFDELGGRWFWTDNISGIVKRYICGAQRAELLSQQEALFRLRGEYDTLVCDDNGHVWPKCKTCEHCYHQQVVVAGWRMRGDVASSAAPLRPAHSSN